MKLDRRTGIIATVLALFAVVVIFSNPDNCGETCAPLRQVHWTALAADVAIGAGVIFLLMSYSQKSMKQLKHGRYAAIAFLSALALVMYFGLSVAELRDPTSFGSGGFSSSDACDTVNMPGWPSNWPSPSDC